MKIAAERIEKADDLRCVIELGVDLLQADILDNWQYLRKRYPLKRSISWGNREVEFWFAASCQILTKIAVRLQIKLIDFAIMRYCPNIDIIIIYNLDIDKFFVEWYNIFRG